MQICFLSYFLIRMNIYIFLRLTTEYHVLRLC